MTGCGEMLMVRYLLTQTESILYITSLNVREASMESYGFRIPGGDIFGIRY